MFLRARNRSTVFNRANRRSQNVQRFAESLSALRQLQGVIKAKNKFLKSISKEEELSEDKLNEIFKNEWDNIFKKELPKKLYDFDFSDLAKIEEQEKKSRSGSRSTTVLNGIPPPPPPLPGAIPPPPGAVPPPPPLAPPVPNSTSAPAFNNKVQLISLNQAIPVSNMTKLHWSPLNVKTPDTIWEDLPSIELCFDDFRDLFRVKSTNDIPLSPRTPTKNSPLKPDEIRNLQIMMKGFPKKNLLLKALTTMDDEIVSRDQVDILLNLVQKKEMLTAVQTYKSSNPEEALGEAEDFLLVLASLPRLEETLSFWRFRQDCEASEMELCEDLHCLSSAIDAIQRSNQFKLLLSVIRDAGNYLNQSNAQGFKISDLYRFSFMKDGCKDKTLLQHLVGKLMAHDRAFLGFDESLIDVLEKCQRIDFDQVKKDIELMKGECENSLKYILLENRSNQDMMEFIRQVMDIVAAIVKIEQLVNYKYKQFIKYLGLTIDNPKPEDLFKIILDFCNEVNSTVSVLSRELEEESKKKQLSKDAVDSPKNNPNLRQKQSFIDAGRPTVMNELQQALARRNTTKIQQKETENEENDELFQVLASDFRQYQKKKRGFQF